MSSTRAQVDKELRPLKATFIAAMLFLMFLLGCIGKKRYEIVQASYKDTLGYSVYFK